MIRKRSLWLIIIVLTLLINSFSFLPVRAEELSQAEKLLQTMSAAEKIGQLFLVTFEGNDTGEESDIYKLITDHHIGGVVLRADKNNFSSENTILKVAELNESLQQIAWQAASRGAGIGVPSGDTPVYIPLFIGIKQTGNGFPGDQILMEITQLPSQMAVGASWDVNLAYQVGELLGSELSALGFNLFLGPNLAVLETVNVEAASSLGVDAYGGHPFWVGEMGKAVISGLHIGSDNRMMIVAQNFPGTGNADRATDLEVATVRKSLDQLRQTELMPFFAVTTPAMGDPARVDAVMLSHVRYQGFQGNIRANTSPISFDSNAFQQLMSLPRFATWREAGGVVVSDNLGSAAIRSFIEMTEGSFQARQVARNAFLAGNDILYTDNFFSTGDPDAYTNLVASLRFFIQKYQEDPTFARRVDASVLRILEAKIRLYEDSFSIGNVLPDKELLSRFDLTQEVTFDTAQNAVTLISPSSQELDVVLPSPPRMYEDIVIFTDARQVSQCENCPSFSAVPPNSLAGVLINLYGPQAGGQLLQRNLTSYTFSQLVEVLDNVESDSADEVAQSLRAAEWVVFNSLNVDPNYPASKALQRILAEGPDLLSGKKVVVFAMDAPIYLDATNISNITAYYALYSKAPEFLEVAARILMQELDPTGALPISLNAAGYDLDLMTSPNPSQVIGLELVLPEPVEPPVEDDLPEADPGASPEATPDMTPTPETPAIPSYNVGDTITIRTSQIYDHNQNVVPDGTIVRFNFRISGEPGITQQFETTTAGGIAFFNYRIEAAGGLDITASSDPATQSETLQINIAPDGSAFVFAFTPTPQFSPTPTETPIPTPTETPEPTPVPGPARSSFPTLGEWALGILVMALGSSLTFMVGYLWWGSSLWGLRSALCALIGGLLAYSYLNLGIDGTKYWIEQSGTKFVVEIVVAGLLIGWIAALVWWMQTEGRYPMKKHR